MLLVKAPCVNCVFFVLRVVLTWFCVSCLCVVLLLCFMLCCGCLCVVLDLCLVCVLLYVFYYVWLASDCCCLIIVVVLCVLYVCWVMLRSFF